jgi:hypothetical protein
LQVGKEPIYYREKNSFSIEANALLAKIGSWELDLIKQFYCVGQILQKRFSRG